MRTSNLLKLTIFLSIGILAACSRGDRAIQATPEHPSVANLRGRFFLKTLLTQWKAQPPQLFTDLSELCRETFIGKNLQEANAMMRAAGQLEDLTITRESAVLTPSGTTPYGGGLELHSSLISGASFNIMIYVGSATPPNALLVKDVRCGIREVSL